MDSYYNGMKQIIYWPIIAQLVVGAVLVAAGVLILVLGHRRYVRRHRK